MGIRRLHQQLKDKLEACYPASEASAITDLVFNDVLSISRSRLITHPDEMLTGDKLVLLEDMTNSLLAFIPIQHLTGRAFFMELPFLVNGDVLIPRPETEQLILLAESCLAEQPAANILDIGTGSGCIPISLKLRNPLAEVTSIDVSVSALAVAKQNNESHQAGVNLECMDFLDEDNWNRLPVFDIILSNPPYIPYSELTAMDKNVSMHEPHLALFVPNEDPFLFYRKIALFCENHLSKEGVLIVETHERLAHQTAEVIRSYGAWSTEVKTDIFGKDRFVIATRCR